jgi:hypothetical protein
MAEDFRIAFLQRHAAECRAAAAQESDPATKAIHLENAASYLRELAELRAEKRVPVSSERRKSPQPAEANRLIFR